MRVAPSHHPKPVRAAALDAQARRLLWRCRRGMKELDVMLERFAPEALAHASPQELGVLEELLALPDPLLAGYLLGEKTPPEPRLARLAGKIRTYVAMQGGSALFSRHAELSGEVTVYSAHGTAAL
ncbi:MAG TPA: succinate dehydrogenase assembly factor 2 [Steroidobacteraceae bacterium]|nr:succinate dehydrogenase assembly factor 2 [Steroidobacteraceae bacterium]